MPTLKVRYIIQQKMEDKKCLCFILDICLTDKNSKAKESSHLLIIINWMRWQNNRKYLERIYNHLYTFIISALSCTTHKLQLKRLKIAILCFPAKISMRVEMPTIFLTPSTNVKKYGMYVKYLQILYKGNDQ